METPQHLVAWSKMSQSSIDRAFAAPALAHGNTVVERIVARENVSAIELDSTRFRYVPPASV
jgi:hypothetical protein